MAPFTSVPLLESAYRYQNRTSHKLATISLLSLHLHPRGAAMYLRERSQGIVNVEPVRVAERRRDRGTLAAATRLRRG